MRHQGHICGASLDVYLDDGISHHEAWFTKMHITSRLSEDTPKVTDYDFSQTQSQSDWSYTARMRNGPIFGIHKNFRQGLH